MDLIARVDRFPDPGETVLGAEFFALPGGKGANQAVAAARLGAEVWFCGKVGEDDFGTKVLATLEESKVNCEFVERSVHNHTAVGLIYVNASGENQIAVASGANATVTSRQALEAVQLVNPQWINLQLEIPFEVNSALVQAFPERVILDPAPSPVAEIPTSFWSGIYAVTPNETECLAITGIDPSTEGGAATAAQWFMDRGVQNVAITLGSQGCVVANQSGFQRIPAAQVEAIDSTGAGDAFAGALSHFLSCGKEFFEAASCANQIAAISTTKVGAMEALPFRHELIETAG